MSKKSQGISINVIIIAAIALAVLVVLFAIFTGRLGSFSKGVQETDTCAQKCTSLSMDKSTSDAQQTNPRCPSADSYISGSYSDGKYGCCCTPRVH